MDEAASIEILLTLGGLLLGGLLVHGIGKYSPLPRVSLLLLLGVAIGPAWLDVLPDRGGQWFDLTATVALVMVGFLLGGEFTAERLRAQGSAVLTLSLAVALITSALVFGGLVLLGTPFPLALLLGGIAPATAPAATLSVIHEVRADGEFTRTLKGIVAIDDVWGIMIFSILMAVAAAWMGEGGVLSAIGLGAQEIGGGLLLGVTLGAPMAQLTGRFRPGEPTLLEALGGVFLCAGLALWLEVSALLTAVVMGATVANFARHHTRPFRALQGVEEPFLVVFFLLAGAALHLDALMGIGATGGLYLVLRTAGRFAGIGVGSVPAHSPTTLRRWMPLALMPQAGVALGMAIVAAGRFPSLADRILAVVIVSTVVFELAGPPLARLALVRSGEARGGVGRRRRFRGRAARSTTEGE